MDSGSILDKVLSSKQTADIERFNPTETLSALFRNLTSKEEDILRRRFGLNGRQKETLEEIGKRFAVTRERIRQIESTAIEKLMKLRDFQTTMRPTEELIREVLETHGSAMTEEALLTELFRATGSSDASQRIVLFLLTELLSEKFDSIGAAEKLRPGWKLKAASLTSVYESIDAIVETVRHHGKPVTIDTLLDQLKNAPYFQTHPDRLNEEIVTACMDLSPQLNRNPYDEYGLISWGTIVPRRMNDKIYLVMKKHGKPLHFNDITRLINDTGFDRRKAYPPTVHNELILNDQYVLVGRGIYALKEWGYQPGIVADVLHSILDASNEPMSREELVAKVLEQRMVKKNTIHLALANRDRFQKLPDGRYNLAGKETPGGGVNQTKETENKGGGE